MAEGERFCHDCRDGRIPTCIAREAAEEVVRWVCCSSRALRIVLAFQTRGDVPLSIWAHNCEHRQHREHDGEGRRHAGVSLLRVVVALVCVWRTGDHGRCRYRSSWPNPTRNTSWSSRGAA